jgi:serine/threonine-protein kinase
MVSEHRTRIRSPRQLKPGTEVRGYRIVRKLAVGGTAWVFEGRHIESDRRVAIKVLNDQYRGDACIVKRFANEARAAMTLESPHIVAIETVGTLSAGLPFLVMEYLEGMDLYHVLEKSGWRMSIEDALHLVDQVAQALDVAHAHGIVHRDIKPENVFILQTDQGALAKVLDFGLSRVPRAGDISSLTRTGTTVGTPHYMALEQLRGDRTIDGRADVYSLGVLTYELLSGHCPFEGPDLHDVMLRAARDEAPPLCTHRPDLPEGLLAAIAHAMERDRNKRCPSARAFREAIRPFWSGTGLGSEVSVEEPIADPPATVASDTPVEPAIPVDIVVPAEPSVAIERVVSASSQRAVETPIPRAHPSAHPRPYQNSRLTTAAAVLLAVVLLSIGITCFLVDNYRGAPGTAQVSLPSPG